ncbi:MAG TPA: DipZ protein [Solirubrobacteraceae bacterium]|jgi:thiol-disulfide isomerase/thioredoxin
MRAPVDTIAAPLFPTKLPWLNTNGARASILKRGQPMLVEFWDFCRPNSIRTLPYIKEWHERYAPHGLRVIGVHCPGFAPSREEQAVREAVERLEIAHSVLIDGEFEVWREYDNRGWPARYLFDGRARLFDYHYGEGGYEETELAIQELLGVQREPLAPLRPEDAAGAKLPMQTPDRDGAWSGEYEAGGVWAVLAPSGERHPRRVGARTVTVNREASIAVDHPGAYQLVAHDRHTRGALDLDVGAGVECFATCFTPGVP